LNRFKLCVAVDTLTPEQLSSVQKQRDYVEALEAVGVAALEEVMELRAAQVCECATHVYIA